MLVVQLCPTLYDPKDCNPPSFFVHGVLQARILEWVVIPFSRGIFLTQGLNLHLLHCQHHRQILYWPSYQGSLWVNKESGFLRWNVLLAQILWKLLTWQQRICYISLVDEAGLKGLTPLLTVGKMPWNCIAYYREIIVERKSLFMWHISLSFYLKKLPQPSQHSSATPVSQQPSTPWQDLHQQQDYNTLKIQMMVNVNLQQSILKLSYALFI